MDPISLVQGWPTTKLFRKIDKEMRGGRQVQVISSSVDIGQKIGNTYSEIYT